MASPVAALSNLVVKLGDLALQEANYLDGVGEKMTRLRTELIWMKCFLKDAAAARRSRKEVVGAWVAEVRELAYEAEDIIETFDIKISSKRRSCILKEDWWLHKMGKKMDEVTDKIAVLTRRAQTYGIQPAADDGESAARRMPRQETFPNEIDKDVVGFDDYTKTLVSVLQGNEKQVVVIAGMGGLGKTTLAKKVFHHREIDGHFEQFAWVLVSQQYRKMHVWRDILLQLECPMTEGTQKARTRLNLNSTDPGEHEPIRQKLIEENRNRNEILNLTDERLQQRIHGNLQDKKCLVVLDDVWKNEDWNHLKAAFPVDQQRNLSKILITSRLETVAQGAKPFLLTPACLKPDQSWELLQKIVFPSSRIEDGGGRTSRTEDLRRTPAQEGRTNESQELQRTPAQEEITNGMDDPNMALAQRGAGRTNETQDLQRTPAQEGACDHIPQITNGIHDANMALAQGGAEITNNVDDPNLALAEGGVEGRTTEAEDSKRKLAHEMVKYCGGLPLAIRVLGGLLTTSSTEWSTIQKNIKSLIARGGNQGQENTGIRGILATSYEDLPAQLKSCFIYMAQFPEDYEISVDKLEKMWIAEGMVEPVQVHWEEGQEELEDIAKSYLNQLIQRSMVLAGNRGKNNELETCRLHDLMRDLCLSKAKEENMLQVLNQIVKDDKSGAHSMSNIGNVRRLAIHELDILYPNPHLRSLWFFSDILSSTEYEADLDEFFECLAWAWKIFWPSRQVLVFVTNKYKLLRVLDLDGVRLVSITLPSEIGELIYLKMLTFGEIRVIKLPSSLGKLRCLQTLVLEKATVCWLSNVVRKLEQLRHLYLPIYYGVWKFKIGRWRNLRTLRNFQLRPRGEAESLGELTQLRELAVVIHAEDFTRDLFKDFIQDLFKDFSRALVNLRNLRFLSMRIGSILTTGDQLVDITPILEALKKRCLYVYKLELSVAQSRIWFPEDEDKFPATITHLSLSDFYFNKRLIPRLAKFPNLRFLTLSNLFGARQLHCTQAFKQLVFLALDSVRILEFIIDSAAMPRLERMEIRCCYGLKSAPKGLEDIKSLQELKIIRMPKEFNDRLVPGGEDYNEVQHIPSVLLIDPR